MIVSTPTSSSYAPHMASEHHLVLSALGPDRPGLVSDVTSYLTERGGNIEDSRMAVFGAEFGILLLVSGEENNIATIARETSKLESKTALSIITRPTKSPEEHRRGGVIPCVVIAEALDHEGIVRSVSGALHLVGVNIVSLETTAYNAPITGSPLFRLEARIDVPRDVTIAKVREAMAGVANRQNIDIDVRSKI
jgi:glycine cleavage system transcriptional repressor